MIGPPSAWSASSCNEYTKKAMIWWAAACGDLYGAETTGRREMKNLKSFERELLADAATRAEYEALADEYAIARELIAARARAGMTQVEVAERMGTTQSVVARLESGRRLPSMRTVERFAQAVGGHLVLRIESRRA